MSVVPASVFLLCLITSAACAMLLFRQFVRTRTRLLFWSALCFAGLTVNNLLVFIDLVVFAEDVSLLPLRHLSSLAALGVLLYAFVWESD